MHARALFPQAADQVEAFIGRDPAGNNEKNALSRKHVEIPLECCEARFFKYRQKTTAEICE